MTEPLEYAVLAMQSYNNTKEPIGNAKVIVNSEDFGGEFEESNFSARAYEINGQVVIAYRGTDDKYGGDAVTGYPTAIGGTSVQAMLALKFYNHIAEKYGSNIILTGHSLGGGLAGYVAALKHKAAYLFDYMVREGRCRTRVDGSLSSSEFTSESPRKNIAE